MKSNRFISFNTLIIIALISATSCKQKDRDIIDNTNKQGNSKEEKTLFTLTDPKETGLYFVNKLKENETFNIITYEYIYGGGGVSVGDINNDGLPDVFLSGNLSGGGLFLNKGDLKFQQISKTAGVLHSGFSTGTSMIDINNDGYQDIYICRSLAGEPELRENILLINNQDLTFTNKAAEYGLNDQSFSNQASFFDYDNDGDLDMYLLNHRVDFIDAQSIKTANDKEGNTILYKNTNYENVSDRLYRNNGNGTFSEVTKKAGLLNRAFGLSVTPTDINKDGWIDLYVANDYLDKDHFYINNGDGSFTDSIDDMFFHMSRNSMGSDVADFNNDGHLDVINLDMMAEHNYRQKQLKGQSPYDMYHIAVKIGLGHQVMRNTLQLNNGNGTFSEIGQLSGISHTDWSWTPLLADYDNDGFKDLFISNGFYRNITDMDFLKYDSNTAITSGGGSKKFNSMKLLNLISSTPVANYIYKNNGDLSFSKKSVSWGFDKPSFSNGAVYADLDQDGDLDLITNNFNQEAFLYRNNSRELKSNHHYLSVQLKGSKNNSSGIGAKVTVTTQDGLQYQECSPYRGYLSSGESILHFGVGSHKNITSISVVWPNGKYQQLNNIAANQRIQLNIEDAINRTPLEKSKKTLLTKTKDLFSPSFRHQENDYIDFKHEPLLEHKLSNKGPFISKGDINNDGLEDVYIGGATGYPGILYVQNNQGKFIQKKITAFETDKTYEDAEALFFDVDADQDLDLFVVSGGYASASGSSLYQDRLYLNDGKGNFSASENAIPKNFQNGTCVTAHDIDGDGDLDLFVGGGAKPLSYPIGEQSQLLINNNGIFTDASSRLPNNGNLGMINDALWMDYDNDGNKNLILAGEWMPITILKNNNSKFIEITNKAGFLKTAGWWNTVSAADIDKDGDLDLIAGNRGENSFYKASEDQPATIYVKDFDRNGRIDAFPFYYFSDGKSYPKHVLDEIATQYPDIKKKFKRYHQYSQATLDSMFSKKEMEGALQFSAHTFSSAHFENKGDGTFEVHNLPKSAQFSEVHGILPFDVNKDGNLDLILTGNNYHTDVEMGRSDASIGAVLLGDGIGNFEAISAIESGFSVIGDAREVTTLQKKDQTLILVVCNEGGLQYFTYQ
ncbi:VCBS repeat-containing protein [uncultured Aquimarina sp.]|uniref:VCBS repeat-containing protein n=1 Tax=uncultured Aquimarina sp. TaxID=575652 RepID=UPI0026326CD7|nr:VCBS repeat-containing protein [uncultured Aquimarina sp.]